MRDYLICARALYITTITIQTAEDELAIAGQSVTDGALVPILLEKTKRFEGDHGGVARLTLILIEGLWESIWKSRH